MNRRGFLLGLGAALAAPAIIRPGILMPVKKWIEPCNFFISKGAKIEFIGANWPADGGFLVPPEFAKEVITYVGRMDTTFMHEQFFIDMFSTERLLQNEDVVDIPTA